MVDALVLYGEEGRSKGTIRLGEPPNGFDPGISEWGNSTQVILCNHVYMELTAGSETSQYREEKKIKIIVKIAASEMTRAQTCRSNTVGVVG